MVTWAEIDDFTQDLERLCDPIPIEAYIKHGIPYRLFPQNFKDLIIRICKEGLEDEHGKPICLPVQECEECGRITSDISETDMGDGTTKKLCDHCHTKFAEES